MDNKSTGDIRAELDEINNIDNISNREEKQGPSDKGDELSDKDKDDEGKDDKLIEFLSGISSCIKSDYTEQIEKLIRNLQ